MKIAIMSDTHDNIWRLMDAMPHLQNASAILHCGDLISPFVVVKLMEGVGNIPVHVVWGNNDGDKKVIADKAGKYSNIELHGEFADLEIDGLRIAMNHYPEIGNSLAYSGKYHLVCFGHNHQASLEQVNDTLLVNPGEVMGLYGRSTMVLFDTKTHQVEWIELWNEEA